MILDKLLQFDAGPTNASTIVSAGVDSTNTLDLLNPRDLGLSMDGKRVEVVFSVLTVFAASGGAASFTLQIQASVDNSTYKILCQTDAIPKANMTAGQQIRLWLPSMAVQPQLAGIPRYYKCTYKATTNDFTSGTFECDLVVSAQANTPPTYPAGVTVVN